MLKKKIGFTLIELIAVIFIMGIIALITIPTINMVVKQARKRTFKITCDNVYSALQTYKEYETIEGTLPDCSIFEFHNDRISSETIENITYEPLDELNLKGQLPTNGTGKICNNKVELLVDNAQYTCIINEVDNKIVEGNIIDNDITKPIINNITLISTTNLIKVIANAIDDDGLIVKYYYKIDDNEYIESDSSSYTFNNLDKNKEYKVTIKVENKSGLQSDEVNDLIKTKDIINPSITQISEVPSNLIYATERTVQINYNDLEIKNPIYYFKSNVEATVENNIILKECGNDIIPGTCIDKTTAILEIDKWYITSNKNPNLVYKRNGTLYALTSDSVNISGTSTYAVTKIDTTSPTVNISVDKVRTDRAIVSAICSDTESEIIKYEFSKDNGVTYIDNNMISIYMFTGLSKNTVYNFKVRCTNGSGIKSEKDIQNTTLGINNPSIIQTNQTPTDTTYASKRILTITYDKTNMEVPSYYFKPSVNSTITLGTITKSCGTGTVPRNCSNIITTTLTKDVWYKTDNTSVNILYTSNGTLYALTSDGVNISGTSTYAVNKIDTTSPNIATSVSGKTATISLSDDIGVVGYNVTTSNTNPTNWTSISQTISIDKTYKASIYGTYYAHVIDVAGNTKYTSFTISSSAFSYSATASCPSGYTQNGSSCNMTLISSAYSTTRLISYSCSSGSLSGSSCYSCSSGTLLGTSCITSSSSGSLNTSYSCPSGYTSSGSGSTMKCYKCSSGWSLSGTSCTKSAKSTSATVSSYSCSSGTLQGSTCYSCSSGALYASSTSQYCYTSSSPKYTCSSGTLSGTKCNLGAIPTNSSTCASSATTSLNSCEASCKKNFPTQSGSSYTGCMSSCNVAYTTTYQNCLVCPTGYTKSGSSCVKTVAANKSCSSGNLNSTGTACITKLSSLITKSATPKYSCSSGTLSGSSCYSCSSGTLSGRTCTTSATSGSLSTTYSCPSGYTSSGSGSTMKCYKCSSGTLSGTSCTISASSTSASSNYYCPGGYTSSGSGSSMSCYKCLSGTLSGSYCYNYYSTSVTYSCPSGGTLNGTICKY